METVNVGAFLTFVIVTTFTPGPNNITSSSMGVLFGYKKTINYLLGITVGFAAIMLFSGIVSRTLYTVFPSLETIMRVVGAGYILWLAYKTVKASYDFATEDTAPLGFTDGLLLQTFNPKVWVYGITLYTTFLATITNNILLLLISAMFLAMVAFSATSTWAISGSAIKSSLRQPRFRKGINLGLTLLLAYTAVDLSGVLALLG